ncbi:MAG TPA: hypothetical protein VHL09_01165, partial [Dehalococcoidia bacterium]|nr:hypothetical protein [Dehalococcoidia bacterium]
YDASSAASYHPDYGMPSGGVVRPAWPDPSAPAAEDAAGAWSLSTEPVEPAAVQQTPTRRDGPTPPGVDWPVAAKALAPDTDPWLSEPAPSGPAWIDPPPAAASVFPSAPGPDSMRDTTSGLVEPARAVAEPPDDDFWDVTPPAEASQAQAGPVKDPAGSRDRGVPEAEEPSVVDPIWGLPLTPEPSASPAAPPDAWPGASWSVPPTPETLPGRSGSSGSPDDPAGEVWPAAEWAPDKPGAPTDATTGAGREEAWNVPFGDLSLNWEALEDDPAAGAPPATSGRPEATGSGRPGYRPPPPPVITDPNALQFPRPEPQSEPPAAPDRPSGAGGSAAQPPESAGGEDSNPRRLRRALGHGLPPLNDPNP